MLLSLSIILSIIMAALCNRAGHYIFALWFLSFFFFLSLFLSSPNLSDQIGCLPYFHTWCGLSANLECMSEMSCKRLAEIQDAKNSQFGTIAQLCQPVSSQLRHVLTIDTSSTRPHNMVNFGLLKAETCWRVWGTPAHFNAFHVTAL